MRLSFCACDGGDHGDGDGRGDHDEVEESERREELRRHEQFCGSVKSQWDITQFKGEKSNPYLAMGCFNEPHMLLVSLALRVGANFFHLGLWHVAIRPLGLNDLVPFLLLTRGQQGVDNKFKE